MKNVLMFIVLLTHALTGLAAYKSDGAKEVQKNCSSKEEKNSALSKLLDSFQDKYKEVEYRNQHPTEMVAALDEIIYKSPFADILKCRDDLLKWNYIYNIHFLKPTDNDQTMSVDWKIVSDNLRYATLSFSTKKSAQRILFVYLHELTHVCQIPTSDQKFERAHSSLLSSTDNELAVGDYYRYNRFQEVEAFLNQQEAFKFFTKESSRLCVEESNVSQGGDASLLESYAEAFESIQSGVFSQAIIYSYHISDSAEVQSSEESFIFDLSSPVYLYKELETDETFKMHALHPLMKKMIEENLRIPVVDPHP